MKHKNLQRRLSQNALFSSHLFRLVHESCWIEEWAEVTSDSIVCYHTERQEVLYEVNLGSVLETRLSSHPQFHSFYFLVLEMTSYTVCLVFADEANCLAFQELVSDARNNNRVGTTTTALDSSELVRQSNKWNCDKRQLLNCGVIRIADSTSQHEPLHLMETCLSKIMELKTIPLERGRLEWQSFFSSVAALKRIDISSLAENARLVFFLNLYHTMILHAHLIVGFPTLSFKWVSFFNSIGYEVADDILSLTELEHCVIRAPMNSPSQALSRYILPNSKYSMALSRSSADFRINFALNCSSLSNPSKVYLYTLDCVDRQLDDACRLYLTTATVTKRVSGVGELIVELPKICQWYAKDFGASDDEVLGKIERFLKVEQQQLLQLHRSIINKHNFISSSMVKIRYLPFRYECKLLELIDGERAELFKHTNLFTIS
uniref:DUF547 domain-containing protein n=1 Tax=Proboscia inermis TaxID=420281 RepID=A0A7S0G7M2_9STRA